jgi:hypothetical protein
VLDADWVDPATRAAAEDFVRFAHTAQGQALVRASGYRDMTGRADPTWRPSASSDPSKINAVVLLSDGRNDTVDQTTEAQMAERLTAIGAEKHVLIFTLAFAEDADKPVLQQISKLTRAHYYDASNPLTVTKVLGDLVTSF